MPNKEMSVFNVEVNGIVTDSYDVVDADARQRVSNLESAINGITIPTDTSDLTNGAGYITSYTETDPIFAASPAHGITSTNIVNWNNKGQVYRGSVTINESAGTASFSGVSPKDICYGNGNVAKKNVISLFYNHANHDVYTLTGHNYDDGSVTFIYMCLSGTTLKQIVSATVSSDSTSTTFSGTYSEISLSTFSGSYNDLSNKPTIPTVPTPDWNAAQGQSGYIANRTHWKEGSILTVLEEQTVNARTGQSNSLNDAVNIPNDGDDVIVSVGGDNPETITAYDNGTNIVLMSSDYQININKQTGASTLFISSGGNYTISAYIDNSVYHKLDSRYLDIDSQLNEYSENPIANGTVTSSIKTIGSIIEGVSNYVTEVPTQMSDFFRYKVILLWDEEYYNLIELYKYGSDGYFFRSIDGLNELSRNPIDYYWYYNGTMLTESAEEEFLQRIQCGYIPKYANEDIVANQYDSSSTYAVGDIVLYNGSLYKCNTAISVAENFDYQKWDHTTVDLTYAKNADLATVAISGSYNDLSNKPTIPTVPTNVSAFTNDAGYLTSAPVSSVNNKTGAVSLSAADVGALPDNTEIHNIPSGGTSGQMLVKKSNTNYDTEWTETYSLPTASDSTLGGVKIGSGISINQNGVISIPTPMQFKGTVGTGGTETSLPSAVAANTGYVYKVITDGTYQGNVAKVGDMLISNGSAWVLVPSGDDASDVQSVDGKTGVVTVLPTGGTTGQYLKKSSDTNYAVEWGTVQENPEIFIGSTTPAGYTIYIDPDGSTVVGEGVSF